MIKCFLSDHTGMGPKPETARAILTMLIWLAGPWQDCDFCVSTSMDADTSVAESPAGMMMLLPPVESLGAVMKECRIVFIRRGC